MLRSIQFSNVKGQTAIQELTGRDIFIGRNGSGKTTRVQSLGLSMLGHVPGQGKTAADTFKLATGKDMTVGLRTDSFQFTRTFTQNEKTDKKTGATTISIKETLAVSPGKDERTETQKKDRIFAEIGNFPVMMDFSQFLSLSDAKRRDFIYSLSPIQSTEWTREKVEDHLLKTILNDEMRENNPDKYSSMEETIREAMKQFPEGFGIHEGIQSMLDWTSSQLTFWNKKKNDSQGAVRQLSDMKNRLEETDRNLAEQKKELEDLQNQLIQVEKLISADEQKKRNVDKRLARMKELRQQIDALEKNPLLTRDDEYDKEISRLQSEIKEVPDVQGKIKEINDQMDKERVEVDGLEKKATVLNQQITSINGQIDALESALKQVGELEGACIITKAIACPKDFSGFDGFVEQKKVKAVEAVGVLEKQFDELWKKRNLIRDGWKTKQDEIQAMLRNVSSIQTENNQIQRQINTILSERDSLKNKEERYKNLLDMYREELNRLANEKDETIGDLTIMGAQVNGLRTRITELKNSLQEKEKSKQTIILLQNSLMENRKSEYKADAIKSINEQLGPKGIQGELVKEIIEPIRGQIEENLKLMGFSQDPFFQTETETGKEVFQFGWVNEKGHTVNFDALSTGQQTVFLAAMMMTIIDRAQPKLKLLVMDNLNHLDKQNFQLLLNGLDKLHKKVDNIILAGAVEFDFEAEGWKVWNLTPEESRGELNVPA